MLVAQCACGKIFRGDFSPSISAPVQYGPATIAATVHLTHHHHHMMPIQRTAALMGDFFGLSMTEATVLVANKEARMRLQLTVDLIAQAIQLADVAHADETGLRLASSLHWMHVLATMMLTWVACHAKRGRQAFDALAILPGFLSTPIHDGWKPYRELTYVSEELGQVGADRMIKLLVGACHEVNANDGPLTEQRVADFCARYDCILIADEAVNSRVQKSGKRRRTRQSKPKNLLLRLRTYADDV